MREPGDRWTMAEDKALKQMSKLGITRVEAARRLGREHSTILVHVRRADLKWTPPPKAAKKPKPPPLGPIPRPWTEEDDRRLAQLAASGVPIGRAANQMDRAYNIVLRHAKLLELKFERDRQGRLRHKIGGARRPRTG